MAHYHFDPLGGIAGDMFVGAMMDMLPDHAQDAIDAVRLAGIESRVTLEHADFTDGVLSGSRFDVGLPPAQAHHEHVHWSALRATLLSGRLSPPVRDRAVAIFAILADAEAQVHDKPVEDVAFHEVGAWDSIADIVAAAYFIELLSPCTWSIGAIPIGSGTVRTDHGVLPVPAPATAILLEGFSLIDDGFAGERVTPTGAAIIKSLEPTIGPGRSPRILRRSGYGFGTRRFTGMSNVLRVLEFEETNTAGLTAGDVTMINFEVDDQSAEDLALGLERLREAEGVLDVLQFPVVGKQGRLATSIQILVDPLNTSEVADACFRETTTIGLRMSSKRRLVLDRREIATSTGVNVKVSDRRGERTAKAELRDVAGSDGHAQRVMRRRSAEIEALAPFNDEP